MRKRKDVTPGLEQLVPSALTDPAVLERARIIAARRVEVLTLKRRRKLVTREIDDDIKAAEALMDKLAQEIVSGQEMLKQGDMFAKEPPPSVGPGPEAPTANEAVSALTAIARAAGDEGDGDAPGAGGPSAPAAVTDEPTPGAGGKSVAPSEPHLYHAELGSDVCSVCGGDAWDEIHGEWHPKVAPVEGLTEAIKAQDVANDEAAHGRETSGQGDTVGCACDPKAGTFCPAHEPSSTRAKKRNGKVVDAADPFGFDEPDQAPEVVGGGPRPAAGFTKGGN